MPELPEVEHVVRALRCSIVGRQILAAEFKLKRIVSGSSPHTFNRKLRSARIESIGRRGKHILINFDNGLVLVVHLRMTGKFVFLNHEQQLLPYSHVVFHLDNDHRLVFCDMRQFGRMRLVTGTRLLNAKELKKLAPEPLSDDFTLEYLQATLSRSQRPIKQLLLDQTKILGLGNIYAAEALFLAGINPRTKAASLSKKRVAKLHVAIQQTLSEAIENGSTLSIDLADGHGSYFGTDERFWRVYERAREPCVTCGSHIRRIVQAGRSTYYCPKCQRR